MHLKISNLEKLILETLQTHGELYGLQMQKIIPDLKLGSTYVTLMRMREKDYVSSRGYKETNWPGKPRQLYKITEIGSLALKAAKVHDEIFDQVKSHA